MALLFWAGGRNWLLGSYWHNVGMRAYWDGSFANAYQAISSAQVYQGSVLTRVRASVIAGMSGDFSAAQKFADQILPAEKCFGYGSQEMSMRLLTMHDARESYVSSLYAFGDIRANWMFWHTAKAMSHITYSRLGDMCQAQLTFDFEPTTNEVAVLVYPVQVLPNQHYVIEMKIKLLGKGIVQFGAVSRWHEKAIVTLTPSDSPLEIAYAYDSTNNQRERFRFMVLGGQGTLYVQDVRWVVVQ